MSALSARLRSLEGGRVAFWCPGCGEAHQIKVGAGDPPRWAFDGNVESPTFSPSILVRGVRLDMNDEALDRVLREYRLPADRERVLADNRINTVCHSFVRSGRIEFLRDCTHGLAGQTVDLPEWPT